MDNFCHSLEKDEILNEKNSNFPLYELYAYGSRLECLKISKRIMCSVKHLPIRVKIHYIYNTQKAVDKGVAKDPSIMLNGNIIIEGLISAEDIEKIFLSLKC